VKVRFRNLVFILCVAAAVLLAQRTPDSLLFAVAAITALANLFSSHLMCALDACRLDENSRSWSNPAYIAVLVNRITGLIGITLLIFAINEV